MYMNRKILLALLWIGYVFPCDSGFESFMGECFYSEDVDVLRVLLENSIGEDINLDMDNPDWFPETSMGNGNGTLEPMEICSQEWEEGRLISIMCGAHVSGNPDNSSSYHWCRLGGEIPYNITNWTEIESIDFEYNNFVGLVPEEICDLGLDPSNPEELSLHSNKFCPPYPECIEDYMGSQSNYDQGCEVPQCYDLGVNQLVAFETNGDNLVNSYHDPFGLGYLALNLYNAGPDCWNYPGILVETNTAGVYIGGMEDFSSYETWWYGMSADDSYGLVIDFEISPFVPPGTDITFTARATTLHCEQDCSTSNDDFCEECPLTDPVSLTITVGESFPNQMGDINYDGFLNILDIILIVDYILDGDSEQSWGSLFFFLSDINNDYNINILDIIEIVDVICET